MNYKIFSISAVILSLILTFSAIAQSDEDSWSDPTNLSHSGSTTDPVIVVDNQGVAHVFWEDEYAGIIYSHLEESQWSDPTSVDFQFETTSKLRLFAGDDDYIHAFWMEENRAQDGGFNMVYSRVQASNISDANAWVPGVRLAESAVDFDVIVDGAGGVHVAYIRPQDTSEFPAGIYYRMSEDDGTNWTPGTILHQSQYFRNLIEEDTSISSNISIANASDNGTRRVFITWDNPPQGRVYHVQSNDGGANWGLPLEVDSPDVESGFASPFGLMVTAYDGEILQKWQVGDSGGNCSHYYQLSSDGGATWGDRQQMMKNVAGCAQDSNFFTTGEGILLLQTTIQDQVYLLAWDGIQWSDPQFQTSLTGFVDPETFRNIDYGCRQYAYHAEEDRLVVVGCGGGLGGSDVWTTSRSVGDVTVWFPPPAIWTAPVEISSTMGEIRSPVLVSDHDGNTYVFWSQVGGDGQDQGDSNLYNAGWDGDGWTRPSALFRKFSRGADQPSVASSENSILYLVWSDLQTGELYFSWTDARRANNSRDWVEPQILPTFGLVARLPVIYIDNSGTIYVVYVVQLNEERGVYLTQSIDGGRTWTGPVRVFDAVYAGWEMIDQPGFVGTMVGKLHILWTQNTLPDGSGPLSLYYASSEDGGLTWSAPEVVVEGPTVWNQILGYGEQTVHRFWQDSSGGHSFVYHQVSYDGGLSWSPATSISSFGMASGNPAVTIDNQGQVHLLQIFREDEEKAILRNWQWDGERWYAGEVLNIGENNEEKYLEIAANVSSIASLGVVYSVANVTTDDRDSNSELHFTNRYVGDTSLTPIPVATVDTTPTPTLEESKIPTPSPSPSASPSHTPAIVAPTPTESLANLEPRPSLLGSSSKGIIYGGVIAGIIVIVILIVYILRRFLPGRV